MTLLLCADASGAGAASFTPAEVAKVDALVTRTLAEIGAPSGSIAVVRDGEIAFAKAYGLRRLDPAAPATPESRYRIASVSKQFTAAAVLMLADEGRLSLDDPLSRYLPEVGANKATIRETLSHTAGFPEFWPFDYLPPILKQATSPQMIVERWGGEEPVFAAGSAWSYSNTGYVVLGRLVEAVSGEPLATFLQAHVFGPAGMASAGDFDGKPLALGDAAGYQRAALGPPREAPLPAAGWTFGAGALAMTASDLARWDIAMIKQRLMSPAAYRAQQADTRLTDGTKTGYGLGVFVDEVGGHQRIRHHGDLPGFWTENRVYPADRAAIVVMVNGTWGQAYHVLIADGVEALLLPPASPKKPASAAPDKIARRLFDQIAEEKLDRAALSASASDYLSGQVLTDYRDSFRRLGQPDILVPMGGGAEEGMRYQRWLWVWPKAQLMVTLKTGPDSKVEEFVAYPIEEKVGP